MAESEEETSAREESPAASSTPAASAPAPGAGAASTDDGEYGRGKSRFVLAAVGLCLGLAFAGTLERGVDDQKRTIAGVAVVATWGLAAFALHRLGRAGPG